MFLLRLELKLTKKKGKPFRVDLPNSLNNYYLSVTLKTITESIGAHEVYKRSHSNSIADVYLNKFSPTNINDIIYMTKIIKNKC